MILRMLNVSEYRDKFFLAHLHRIQFLIPSIYRQSQFCSYPQNLSTILVICSSLQY